MHALGSEASSVDSQYVSCLMDVDVQRQNTNTAFESSLACVVWRLAFPKRHKVLKRHVLLTIENETLQHDHFGSPRNVLSPG